MRLNALKPLLFLLPALALIMLAYRQAPEAPKVLDEESFIPRTEAVQWMSLGHRSTAASLLWINGLITYGDALLTGKSFRWITHLADASTRLDTLFKTPYTFVAAITPIAQKDTSDFPVLRRGIAKYPQDWQLAVSFCLRLSEGPTQDYAEAARIMKHFVNDTTVPVHVRTLHQSFYLHTQTTEIALSTIIDDCLNPRYSGYRSSLVAKAARALGREPRSDEVKPVWAVMDPLFKGHLEAGEAFARLMALKKMNIEN